MTILRKYYMRNDATNKMHIQMLDITLSVSVVICRLQNNKNKQIHTVTR